MPCCQLAEDWNTKLCDCCEPEDWEYHEVDFRPNDKMLVARLQAVRQAWDRCKANGGGLSTLPAGLSSGNKQRRLDDDGDDASLCELFGL